MAEDLKKEIESFSSLICTIKKDTKKETVFQEIESYFKKNPIKNDRISGRVWILIGQERENKSYISLIVAQSEDIKKEISSDVKDMYNSEFDVRNIKNSETRELKNGNEFVYEKGAKCKNQYLYRFLKEKYAVLKIYEIDIDTYLGSKYELHQSEHTFYELSKDYFAEAKLAVEKKPMYWDYYRSGVGKRAYYYLKKH